MTENPIEREMKEINDRLDQLGKWMAQEQRRLDEEPSRARLQTIADIYEHYALEMQDAAKVTRTVARFLPDN